MTKYSLSILFAFVTICSFGQSIFNPTGPSGGGAMYSPSINPHNGNLFLICDMGELFTSPDGQDWQLIPSHILSPNINSEVQFTADPNILYSINFDNVTQEHYAVKSTDGGTHWQALADDPTGGNCTRIFVDATTTNKIIVSDAESIHLSTDGGNNFSIAYQATGPNVPLYIAGCFWDASQVFIGVEEGLLVSNNGGSSFLLDNTAGIPSGKGFFDFTGSKANGITRLYGVVADRSSLDDAFLNDTDLTGNNEVIQCDFGVSNWQQSFSQTDIRFFRITSSPTNINKAYVAADLEEAIGRIFKTTDGGGSWSNVLLTNNNQNITTAWAGEDTEYSWAWSGYAHGIAVAANNPDLIIISDWGFAFISNDGGQHWQQVYAGQSVQNPEGTNVDESLAYLNNGLNVTTTWNVSWFSPNDLFASYTDITGWRSNDNGQSWKNDDLNNTYNTTYQVIKHPTNNTVYAAVSDVHDMYTRYWLTDDDIESGPGAILFSNNNASSWSVLHDFNLPVVDIVMDPNNAEVMYAAVVHSQSGDLYKTTNLSAGVAATWTRLTSPPRTEGHPYKINVLNDGSLVVSYSGRLINDEFTASSGVFYSDDGGATWSDRSHNDLFYWTKDVIVDPNDLTQNTWYACVQDGETNNTFGKSGVFKTTDRGVSWTKILANVNAESVGIHPLNADKMYVCTEYRGLWHTDNLSAAQPSFARLTAYPFYHPMRVVFNPYDANDIWITSFGAGLMRGTSNLVLTVEYQDELDATVQNNQIQLSWITSNEEDADYFEIERSSHAKNWKKVGTVQANNNTNTLSSYITIDRNPFQGVSYYRLKQFDFDGSYSYSRTVKVVFNERFEIDVLPNPTQGNIELRITNPTDAVISIIDATGKQLYQINTRGTQIKLDLSQFPNGFYWITVYSGGEMTTTKVVLQK